MSAMYITLAFILLMGAAMVAVYAALFGTPRVLDDRITDMGVKMRVGVHEGGLPSEVDPSLSRALFRWVAQRLPAPAVDSPKAEKLAHLLMQAGYQHSARRANLSGGARNLDHCVHERGLNNSARGKPLGCDGDHGAGRGRRYRCIHPELLSGTQARKRQRAIGSQLSDVLDLLVVCVEAGLGLSEAIKVVGAEAERHGQAIGNELALVSGELAAGSSLGQALRQFADRTAVADVRPLAATLIQSEQIGAQIGPALRSISDSLRSARKMRAEEAAQKTTVKIMFPLVLFVLPAMMSVIVGPAMIQIMQTLTK